MHGFNKNIIFIIISVVSPLFLYSQISVKQIDSLVNEAKQNSETTHDRLESIRIGKQVIKESERISYKKGEITGHCIVAFESCNVGDYKNSLKTLQTIKTVFNDSLKKGLRLQIFVNTLLGRNYDEMGNRKEAVKSFKNLLAIADKHPDSSTRMWLKRVGYSQLSDCYDDDNTKIDSLYYYLTKALHWHNNYNGPKLSGSKTRTPLFHDLAEYHIDHSGRLDSAQYYIARGNSYVEPIGFFTFRSDYLNAKIYYKKKEYQKAVSQSLKSIKDARNKNKRNEILKNYHLLSSVYDSIKNDSLKSHYQLSYYQLKDSIDIEKQQAILASIDILEEEWYERFKLKEHKTIVIFVCVILVIFGSTFGIIRYIQTKKKEQVLNLNREHEQIEGKENKESLQELMQLAKKNAPEFLTKFEQVYPDFNSELVNQHPDLRLSERQFSAYLRLHFTTKQIAKFLCISPKAVQNRKHRIRKKLDIPNDMNIYTWFDELG